MFRTARHNAVAGIILAVLGVVMVDVGGHLGLQLIHLGELGLAAGAVLGLVDDRAPGWRAGSFAVGFLAAWLGYALRAGALPDTALGRAIATGIVVLVVTLVATASSGRLALWSGLLGVAALSGAYEVTFSQSPTTFTTDSVTAASTVALAAAFGFLVSTALTEVLAVRHGRPDTVDEPAPPPPAPSGPVTGNVITPSTGELR